MEINKKKNFYLSNERRKFRAKIVQSVELLHPVEIQAERVLSFVGVIRGSNNSKT